MQAMRSMPVHDHDHLSLGGLSVASNMSSMAQQFGSLAKASSMDHKITLGGGASVLYTAPTNILGPLPMHIAVESSVDSMESLLEWEDEDKDEKTEEELLHDEYDDDHSLDAMPDADALLKQHDKALESPKMMTTAPIPKGYRPNLWMEYVYALVLTALFCAVLYGARWLRA